MAKIKGNLNIDRNLDVGNPLSKSNGGTGEIVFPFFDSHSGNTSSQVISSQAPVDVTNSSKSVAFPSNAAYAVFISNLNAQNAVGDLLARFVDIDNGTLNQIIGQVNAGAVGLSCNYSGSTIIDVSSFAGTTVTLKLQASRIFNNFTLGVLSWKILVF